jgi:hypothetical protein
MAAIYSNGGNRWNILGFNFTKRDALSSVYKISSYGLDDKATFRNTVPRVAFCMARKSIYRYPIRNVNNFQSWAKQHLQ